MSDLSSRVYKKLLEVPRGKVTTYAELAKAVGIENGQRAIGNIMNKNPNPILVPCHRVVRSDGSVGGYAFGEAGYYQRGQKTNLCQKDPLVKISTRSCKRPWRATKRRILETLQDDARKHGKKQSTSALSYGRSTSKKILKSVYCIIHVYDKAIPYLNAL